MQAAGAELHSKVDRISGKPHSILQCVRSGRDLQNSLSRTHSITMPCQALTPSFVLLPGNRRIISQEQSSQFPLKSTCPLSEPRHNLSRRQRCWRCALRQRHDSCRCRVSPFTATLAAVAVLFSRPGNAVANEGASTLIPPAVTSSELPAQDDLSYQRTANPPQGTLIRVHPNTQNTPEDSNDISRKKGAARNSTSPFPQHTAGVQGWAGLRLQRSMRSPRPIRIMRVRPTTLGLVGVGAFTSGSVFLRSISRKSARIQDESLLSVRDVCSVVSMQIPFCVSERLQMLQTLDELAKNSSLNDAEGMAEASRTAATILLEEEGLLEDSRKFAPYIDVFLAENLMSAEKRFSCQVRTEESRLQKVDSSQAEMKNQGQRLYGVVTMVVATMEGVDLECYDEHCSLVSRLRHALDNISLLRGGEVAGLELIWVPESVNQGPLTRAQIADAYPWLRVG